MGASRGFCLAVATMIGVVASAEVLQPADISCVKIKGYVADRLEGCVRRHVEATDVHYLANVFSSSVETSLWQTEFWGKWMHSAGPFARAMQSDSLLGKIRESTAVVLAAQEPDGYIGNYPKGLRAGEGWDVWGNKYTLLGLLHAYQATGSREILDGACRLADCLLDVFGPGKRSLAKSGNFRGLPSCSVLEPIVWLYRETGDRRYLDFAGYVVSELDAEYGPRLLADSSKPVADRVTDGTIKGSALKSYETMSCCQGLLDYFDVAGDQHVFEAVLRNAESIRRDEINLAGGASSSEHWYRGRDRQTETYVFQQETCVQTTWMRLAGKLLRETADVKWAEEVERTFYNAYLGSLGAGNDVFTQYCPLTGTRSRGAYHCRMHTNCCNANGPRGFLVFLENFLLTDGKAAFLNFYSSGEVSAKLSDGTSVRLEVFTLYPSEGTVHIQNLTERDGRFALNLRIPAWADGTRVAVNGTAVADVRAGSYLTLDRDWKTGDQVEIAFPMKTCVHVLNEHVAFTRGPLLLARDRRFGDGDFSETLQRTILSRRTVDFVPVAPGGGMWNTFAGLLPLGTHLDNPEAGRPKAVRLCD